MSDKTGEDSDLNPKKKRRRICKRSPSPPAVSENEEQTDASENVDSDASSASDFFNEYQRKRKESWVWTYFHKFQRDGNTCGRCILKNCRYFYFKLSHFSKINIFLIFFFHF
jgi:hypothetical protein